MHNRNTTNEILSTDNNRNIVLSHAIKTISVLTTCFMPSTA